jgi:Ku70/Ku80 N-terminal alpha/beta domain
MVCIMFIKPSHALPRFWQGIELSDTWFGIALKVVRATLKQKIISSPNDQSAVVLYGTVGDSCGPCTGRKCLCMLT